MENLLIITEFLEETGVSIQDMEASYDEKTQQLILKKKEHEGDEYTFWTVTAKMNVENNSVMVKSVIRREYDFESIGDDPMTSYQTYNVDSHQILTKFKASNGVLNSYSVDIFQTVREDTMGGGNWIIVDVDTFSDVIDQEKRDLMIEGIVAPIEKNSYTIPLDYKITDGMSKAQLQSFQKESAK